MSKIIFNTITSGFGSAGYLNSNFTTIEQALQTQVLYRDNPAGEPNTMQCNLDMNGYNILNLGNATVLASASVVQAISWGTQLDGTGTHTVTTANLYRITEVSSSSSVTACIALTTEAVGGWSSGGWMSFIQVGSGKVKIVGNAGVTVRTSSTQLGNIQYGKTDVYYRGSDIWYVNGGF